MTHWLDLIKAVSGIIALLAFLSGVFQYHQSQNWKKMEFVSALMKEFEADPAIKNVMLMLDWYERKMLLIPEAEGEGRFVTVTDQVLGEALVAHTDAMHFSDGQVAIREHFDLFLDYLERFDHFIQAKLVSKKEFEPYLIYWVEAIAGSRNRRPPFGMERLREYIDFYGFTGVQRLCQRYGHSIVPLHQEKD